MSFTILAPSPYPDVAKEVDLPQLGQNFELGSIFVPQWVQ
jgi:hypothetical protein